MARTHPSLPYGALSIIAGLAASFALINPKLNESLPGVAISVALIPPLAVIGIGIALLDWTVVSNAFLLFIINIGGIIFASMITFSLMNFYVRRKVAQVTIAKDEQEIEAKKIKAKKIKDEIEKQEIETHAEIKETIDSQTNSNLPNDFNKTP